MTSKIHNEYKLGSKQVHQEQSDSQAPKNPDRNKTLTRIADHPLGKPIAAQHFHIISRILHCSYFSILTPPPWTERFTHGGMREIRQTAPYNDKDARAQAGSFARSHAHQFCVRIRGDSSGKQTKENGTERHLPKIREPTLA